MWVFYFFAVIVIWQGLMSLASGVRFLAYVRREMEKPPNNFTPFVSLIAPCRGLDQGLRENLAALFRQSFPAYEIIFVTDRADDPAIAVIEEARREFEKQAHITSRLVIAGEATGSGQKVHNLLAAVAEADVKSFAFIFADTDARPSADWLRWLISPLNCQNVGAATGYRWFIPERGGFSSHLRAVWNASIASALGERGDRNFCWGGATAIRRETFEKLVMRDVWRGTLSDDFALMRALRRAKLDIYFVPACLTASVEDCGLLELLEFTTRQLKITRVYAPHFWKAVLAGSLLFVSVFFGGLALVITRAALGLSYWLPLMLLSLIFILGAAKAALRLRAVRLPLKAYDAELTKGALAHLTLWPLASALYLYNAVCALFSRRINWRGITYELKSPTETVIMEKQVQSSRFKVQG
ncbi:MAG TPA: glycosyltransferase [Pyrinomonadaceae bacterium]|jgi:cellulose synthase/poly-beta-1,6-N-acetylglucosamine synthase-like glycosyltransferase